MSHTPVTILTGFLGSGKTTLLNRALRDPAMANTAVVINEFGEVGLDHMLAARSDDTIMVLENGCLCCTVFGDLVYHNFYATRFNATSDDTLDGVVAVDDPAKAWDEALKRYVY